MSYAKMGYQENQSNSDEDDNFNRSNNKKRNQTFKLRAEKSPQQALEHLKTQIRINVENLKKNIQKLDNLTE